MNYRIFITFSFVIVASCFSYEATIINHTPWELKGRPTRAWKKMEDRTIKPYQEQKWDSGITLISGTTLDLVVDDTTTIKEVLKESYVCRAVHATYHIFAQPFLDENNIIKKFKLILVREPAGGIGNTAYPGGIVKESSEIDLTPAPSSATKKVATLRRYQKSSTDKSVSYKLASAQ